MKTTKTKYVFMALPLSVLDAQNETRNYWSGNSVRYYGNGDLQTNLTWGNAASAASTLAGGIYDIINDYNTLDIEQFKSNYNKTLLLLSNKITSGINSFDDLSTRYSNYSLPVELTDLQLGITSGIQVAGSAMGSALSGAAAGGMVAGPLGAGIGALLMGGLKAIGLGHQNSKRQLLKTELAKRSKYEYNRNIREFSNIGKALKTNLLQRAASNPYAFGGALEYDFILQYLLNNLHKTNNRTDKITSIPNSFSYAFADGGHTNGGIFSNGITHIKEGGTHELNPNGGVLIGYDLQGAPNLVEEGEYIWNDYVFSNRLKVPKEVKNTFGLGGKKDGYTFAEAVDFIQKESEERPNDPISTNSLERQLTKLASILETLRQHKKQTEQNTNKFYGGGWLDKKEWLDENGNFKIKKYFEELLLDEYKKNPGEYLEQALSQYWDFRNGDVSLDDILFSTLMLGDPTFALYIDGTKKIKDITDSEALDLLTRLESEKYAPGGILDLFYFLVNLSSPTRILDYIQEQKEIPLKAYSIDPTTGNRVAENVKINGKDITVNTHPSLRSVKKALNAIDPTTGISLSLLLKDNGYDLSDIDLEYGDNGSEITNLKKISKLQNTGTDTNVKAISTKPKNVEDNTKKPKDVEGLTTYPDYVNDITKKNPLLNIRYAEPIGKLGLAISDALGITNTPDYSIADLIGSTADDLTYATYTPVGLYLTYKPFDTQYAVNKLNSQAGATRRALLNNAGLNRGAATAGLLAADYNTLNLIGDLLIKADEYNNKQRQAVAEFNRATDLANSEGFMQAAIANQNRDRLMADIISREAALRQEEKNLTDTAKSTNISGLFDSLGGLGKELAYEDMIRNNLALLYDSYGNYKKDNAMGGYLTIKNKKR